MLAVCSTRPKVNGVTVHDMESESQTVTKWLLPYLTTEPMEVNSPPLWWTEALSRDDCKLVISVKCISDSCIYFMVSKKTNFFCCILSFKKATWLNIHIMQVILYTYPLIVTVTTVMHCVVTCHTDDMLLLRGGGVPLHLRLEESIFLSFSLKLRKYRWRKTSAKALSLKYFIEVFLRTWLRRCVRVVMLS